MDLKKLEQTGAIQTLLYLYKVGEASKTDIQKNIDATYDTLKTKTFSNLERLGIISIRKFEEYPFTHMCSLTKKGIKLAKCLYEFSKSKL